MLQNEVSDATDHTSILNVCQNLHVVSQYEDVPALMYSMDLTQVSSCVPSRIGSDPGSAPAWGVVPALIHSIDLSQVTATLTRPPTACVAHHTHLQHLKPWPLMAAGDGAGLSHGSGGEAEPPPTQNAVPAV